MSNHEHRSPAPVLGDGDLQGLFGFAIEIACRFVEDEQLRLGDDYAKLRLEVLTAIGGQVMRAYEFPATVTSEGKLFFPKETSLILPHGHDVRVIILVSESTADEGQKAWSTLTAEQFLAGYSDADSIYDEI